MKTPSILKNLALTSMLFLLAITGRAQTCAGSGFCIDMGLEVSGTTLIVKYLPSADFITSPNNQWSTSVITLRWPAVGPGMVNPVTSFSSFTSIMSSFGISEDVNDAGAPDPYAPVLVSGYYYKRFAGDAGNAAISLTSAVGSYDIFSIDFTTSATSITFEIVPKTGGGITNSAASVQRLFGETLDGFAPQTAVYNAGSFPVEWLYFDAKAINSRDAQLRWATAQEGNNDFFQVEKSVDGEMFAAIGKVDGAGNSTITREYDFLDKDYVADKVYYRIKQVDYDGQFTYSEKVEVNFNSTAPNQVKFELFPNPATSFVTLKALDRVNGTYRVEVVDVTGRKVWNGFYEGAKDRLTIPVDDLAQGVYMVYMIGSNLGGNHLAGKFVKE